ARADARIVTPLDLAGARLSGLGGGALRLADRCGRADRDAHHDLRAIADAAGDPARVIGEEAIVLVYVIRLRALELAHAEAAADLHSLGGRNREHRRSQH